MLARSIFATDDVESIAARVEGYCREAFGAAVASCALFTQSVGAVLVLDLTSGERVVLKVHGGGEARWGSTGRLESLVAAYEVQAALAGLGLPCARVLRPPRPWQDGTVAAMSYLDGGPAADPHRPEVARSMAALCARVVALAAPLRDRPDLPVQELPAGTLWPTPHNVLFDMSAPGGDWIDDRAREARAVLDAERPRLVLAHTDVSGSNVRVVAGAVTAVYDMDSVALADEVQSLASIAVHFTYTGDEGKWTWPTGEEARTFVADYERARGRPFTAAERTRLDAAAIYSMSYTARCELSGPGGTAESPGCMRDRLRNAPSRGHLTATG